MKKMINLALIIGVLAFNACDKAEIQNSENELSGSTSGKQSAVISANPSVVNGVATYNANITIGPRFLVPDAWKKIVIKANVRVKGNFIIKGPQRDFEIVGENWSTSILDGSSTTYVKGDRSLCNVRFENHGTLRLYNFQSLNPANFHITAWAPLTIVKMRIIENRRRTSTDAAHSTKGLTIDSSFISTYDDVLYVGECSAISNTTIEHNANGAPFMVSWGHNADGMKTVATNVTIVDNEDSNWVYAHGIVGWAQKNDAGIQTPIIEWINCRRIVKSGKTICREFYSFGNNGNTVTDGIVKQIGGLCSWTSPIRQRNGSNGIVLTQNCQ